MPPTPTCTMPEHGHPDAPHACCRPPAAVLPATVPESDAPVPVSVQPVSSQAVSTQAMSTQAKSTQPGQSFWRHLPTWWRASSNTAHCLLGCAIGDIAAMTLVPLAWPGIPTWLLMGIAIISGIVSSLTLETVVLRLREGLAWGRALSIAWGMSLLSMVAMEVVMNLTDWVAMGGKRMSPDHLDYWLAWIPALIAGFLAPLPYNYAQLRRHGRSCH